MKEHSLLCNSVAELFHVFFHIKKKHWVFASDYGNLYRESSKYLFEYMNREHPEVVCTYIVRNPRTYQEIKTKGLNVEMNTSIRGLKAIAEAEAVFTTQWLNDMNYAYVKDGRKFYYLNHGQSMKKQMNALPKDFWNKVKSRKVGVVGKPKQYRKYSYGWFVTIIVGHFCKYPRLPNLNDVSFVSANSVFFLPFFRNSYGEKMSVKILGMPRNDALFLHNEMKRERWIDGADNRFIVTYMPTHRMYGIGEITPTPFVNRPQYLQWMKDNNVLLIMKQHPNMKQQSISKTHTDVIRDITNEDYDPQVVIYHSDVLISDYSSVWLDYLLLRRPLITYLYDNFEKEDVGLNIDIQKETPGLLCFNEDELFDCLQRIKLNYDKMRPTEKQIRKFYKDPDGNACQRYYIEIARELNY